ncbi:hypothetical protein I553_2377 [Mycobacterium xenopi 4042]|uniref:Uncharacterized protein n=1 Tax=Mycobacterium xenopi 4042 TaxID=1299334 RepID=X8AP46_MYCXE|nr:hypothetical protein I553_2377 [Mycobacterium xenopi 4042]
MTAAPDTATSLMSARWPRSTLRSPTCWARNWAASATPWK